MSWLGERRQEFFRIIRGDLKKDVLLHDQLEAQHWDAKAESYQRDQLRSMYLDFENYVAYSAAHALYLELARTGASTGRLLEIGCGLGLDTVFFASKGLDIVALDVSQKMLNNTRWGAELNGFSVDVVQASAHHLPFKDQSFAAVVGAGTLHHLNVSFAGPEIHRVLKPGGHAVFIEPIQMPEPLLQLRSMLPLRLHESPGGGTVSKRDLRFLKAIFGQLELHRFNILETLCRFSFMEDLRLVVSKIDRALLAGAPGLGFMARTGVIHLRKTRS